MCVNRTLLNLKTSSDRWLWDGIGGARLPAGDIYYTTCPFNFPRPCGSGAQPGYLYVCNKFPRILSDVPPKNGVHIRVLKQHVLKPKRCRCFSRKTSKIVVE